MSKPASMQSPPLVVRARPQLSLHRAAEALDRGGGDDAFRRPADAHEEIDAGTRLSGCDGRRDVAVADEVHARSGLAKLGDEVVVAVALEDDDREIVDGAVLRLGDALEVLGRRHVDVDRVGCLGADGDLVHVQRGTGEEHRPALRDGDDRDRVRHAERREPRSLERVDRDVDLGSRTVADLLAVEQHRRLVLLALADDDDAAHGDRVEHEAHGVDRCLIRRDLVPAPDPARRERCGRLRDANQLEREIPVRYLAHVVRSYIRSGASTPTRSRQRAMTICTARTRTESERLLLGLEHAMLVIEAVEVVGDADRVDRDRVRRPPLGRLSGDLRELEQALHQLALLRSERRDGGSPVRPCTRALDVPQDPGDARVRVLHVVDRVLVRALLREIDVELDRLVVATRDEVPASRIHADRVEQLVEEHDVATPLGHLLRRAPLDELDELVDQHLERLARMAEHLGERLESRDVAVVIGAENVDQASRSHARTCVGCRPRPPRSRSAPLRSGRAPDPCRPRTRSCAPTARRPPRTCRAGQPPRGSRPRRRSAVPTCRSGCGTARASPRSARA